MSNGAVVAEQRTVVRPKGPSRFLSDMGGARYHNADFGEGMTCRGRVRKLVARVGDRYVTVGEFCDLCGGVQLAVDRFRHEAGLPSRYAVHAREEQDAA